MRRHDFRPMNEKVLPFVDQLKGAGYGLDFVAPAPGKLAAQPPQVEGQRLEKQAESQSSADLPRLLLLVLALLAAATAAGALRQSGRLPTFRFFTYRSHTA